MRYAVILLVLVAGACSSTLGTYETRSRVHVVAPGDTLYTIAWRHGVDYRQLAAWNNLRNPDLIFVGQRLRVTGPPVRTRLGAESGAATTARTSGQPARAPPQPAPPEPPVLPPPEWQWPTQGPLLYRFGAKNAIGSGIGIGGRSGQAINAAASGRVVYAGSGLIGYGQLVIIMHNDTYLSAYGHNSRLLVVQGQEVRRGQKIAEMGLGPQREPRLHFEVRRNGVPIDPLPFLRSAG